MILARLICRIFGHRNEYEGTICHRCGTHPHGGPQPSPKAMRDLDEKLHALDELKSRRLAREGRIRLYDDSRNEVMRYRKRAKGCSPRSSRA